MIKKRLFYDKVSFTADTDDITIIQPRYIHAIDISLQAQQAGTAALTLSEILSILNKVQVKLTGKIVTELSATDILAYNCLVGNRSIKYVEPTAANEYGYVDGLSLPLQLKPGEHVLSVRFLYNAVADATNPKLSFSTLEADEALAEKHVEMPTFTFTPPSTGAYNVALDATYHGDVVGFIFYSTTIPTNTSDTASLAKLRLKVGGDIVFEDTWHNLAAQTFYPEDSTLRSMLDNYVFVDFRKAPIAAGTRIEVEILSDDTNPVRIIPIIMV